MSLPFARREVAGQRALCDRGPSTSFPPSTTPAPQALLRNPELLRSMLQANPSVRQMMESNPEVGRMLSDPDTLRQMSAVMSNPVRGWAQLWAGNARALRARGSRGSSAMRLG